MKEGPYKLTPECQALVCSYLAKGCYLETAALSAGITRETLRLWQKRGADQRKRRVRGKYRSFLEAVERAMAEHEGALVAHIAEAGETQWTANAWLLERRWPARYEQHRTTEREKRLALRAERTAAQAADPTEGMTDDELRAEVRRLTLAGAAGAPTEAPAPGVGAGDDPALPAA